MKKVLMFILLGMFLVSFVAAECIDSDGINTPTKGYVNQSNNISWDECLDSKYVKEMYCDQDVASTWDAECSYGCVDGACIKGNESINLIFPNGGEILNKGNLYTIAWEVIGQNSNALGSIDVFIFNSEGDMVFDGFAPALNNGTDYVPQTSFIWNAEDVDEGIGYSVKISNQNGDIYDESDSTFSIITEEDQSCTESWSCNSWSSCANNTQTRTCTDSNSCGTTTNKPSTSQNCTIQEDTTTPTQTQKICCHIYGLGSMMKKVNSRYQWIQESECAVSEDFVGGGREVMNDEYCLTKKIIQARNRIKAYYNNQAECPEECTCTGSVMKCDISGGRQMTIRAGNSGNTIVQVKNTNMSTKVVLYKANNSLYGVFRNNQTRVIKVLPDQVREKIRERIKAQIQDEEIELDEDGVYQVRANKRARLFLIIPVKEKIRTQINSETGEIIKTRTSWWGFLARDLRE